MDDDKGDMVRRRTTSYLFSMVPIKRGRAAYDCLRGKNGKEEKEGMVKHSKNSALYNSSMSSNSGGRNISNPPQLGLQASTFCFRSNIACILDLVVYKRIGSILRNGEPEVSGGTFHRRKIEES